MKQLSASIILIATILLSGCISPLTVEKSAIHVPISSSEEIAVAVIENRPYVMSGKKSEQFEGVMRRAFGIPFDFNNIEKKKFSDYIGDRLVQGFSNAGYTVQKLSLHPGATDEEVRDKIIETQSDRGLTVRMNDWRVDWGGFMVPSWQFYYDVDIDVYDKNGDLLCRRSFSGRDAPPVEGWDSPMNNSVKHYQSKLIEFLDNQSIVAALHGIRDKEIAPVSTAKERLIELQLLLDSELISENEFSEKRKQLLEGL